MNATFFFRQLRRELKEDRIGDVAAMMAYYAVLALFPMMLVVITVGMLILPQHAIDQGVDMISRTMPMEAATLLREQLFRMAEAAHGSLAIGGLLVALWSASNGAVSLGRALNDVFDLEETRSFWRVRIAGLAVTIGVAIILLFALGVLVAGPIGGEWIADRIGLGSLFQTVWTVTRWLMAALLVMFVWALLYRVLPNTHAPLRIFTPGAVVGTMLWVGASVLFGWYVSNFGKYDQVYGALGAAIIFLVWLWLSNLALLLGAEINDAVAETRRASAPPPRRVTTPRGAEPATGAR